MRNQKMKKLLCLLLALTMLFTSTVALAAEAVVEEYVAPVEAYLPEYPVEEREEPPSDPPPADPPAASTRAGITITRAQIIRNGGQHQVMWRNAELWDISPNTVYRGDCALHGDASHNPANWYTTARIVNLQESRRFFLEIVVPRGEFTGVIDTPTAGTNPFDPTAVTITYTSNGVQTLAPADTRVYSVVEDGAYFVITAGISTVGVGWQAGQRQNAAFAGIYDAGRPSAANWNRIGYWPLDVSYTGQGVIATKQLRTSISDSTIRWREFDAWAKEFVAAFPNGTDTYGCPELNRFMKVESYGTSHGGRDLWAVIISDSAASVDDYLTRTVPLMNSDPAAMQQAILDGTFDHRGVIMLSANHGNEVAANAIFPEMMDRLLNFAEVRFPVRLHEHTHWIAPTGITWTLASGTRIGPRGHGHDALYRGGIVTETICIDELLAHYIIVIQWWTNPDGNEVPRRTNDFGTDPNRDGGQFNFRETQSSVAFQSRWDPIYFMELHDLVRSFQNDGCTPPIEASLEADLIDDFMVCLLEAMGYAALGVSYSHFNIPMRDQVFDWDAGTLIYSASKAMMNGSLGSTLEYAGNNNDTTDSGLAGFFGTFQFMIDNFTTRDGCRPHCGILYECDGETEHPGLFWNKLEFKRRGVENVDSPSDDAARRFVDWRIDYRRNLPPGTYGRINVAAIPAQRYLPRPRQVVDGETMSFFPEYWVIPVDRTLQYSPGTAALAMELLQRLGHVYIYRTTEQVIAADGTLLPAGTYVVPMHQARRSFAHGVLYDGFDSAIFGSLMYDLQTIVSWPAQRGFTAIQTWETGLFDGATERVNLTGTTQVELPGDGEFVIFQNTGLDAIRLTNRLLNDDRDVWMVTSYIPGALVGDFIARRADVAYMVGPRVNPIWGPMELNVFAIDGGNEAPAADVATPLVQPTLAIARPGSNETRFMLEGGLEFTQFENGATGPGAVWVGAGAPPAAALNIPVVMWNASAANVNSANALGANAVVAGNVPMGGSQLAALRAEMLGRATWSGSSLIAPGYEMRDTMITLSEQSWITPRADVKVLGQFVNVPGTGNTEERGSQIFLAGRRGVLRAADYSDRIQVITGINATTGQPVTAMSQNIIQRARLQSMWHLLGSSVLAYAAGITDAPRPTAVLDDTNASMFPAGTVPVSLRRNHSVDLSTNLQGGSVYVHWFAENSAGVSNQGTFGPFRSGTVNLTGLPVDTAGNPLGLTLDTFKFVVSNDPLQAAFDPADTAWQNVPANGNIVIPSNLATDGVYTWHSNNPAAATVSANGVVTARVATGAVVITARNAAGEVVFQTTLRLMM